jgi:hypothetical protein
VATEVLRTSRQRTDADWEQAIDSLRSRGWLDADGALTEHGRAERQWIEDRTDQLALAPYEVLGETRCEELRAMCRPTSRAMSAAIGF